MLPRIPGKQPAVSPYFRTVLKTKTAAAARTALGVSTGIYTSVIDYGATGDGSTDDSGAVQDAIDAVEAAGGGVVFFPAGNYNISTTGLVISASNIHLVGEGGDYDETGLTVAPTRITYSGTGSAITLGSSAMAAAREGVQIRDLEVKGDNNGVAGIHFEANLAVPAFYSRCLIENVSVQGFGGASAAGIRFDFGVSNTLRRTNTFLCANGILINGGTTYNLDGVITRLNTVSGLRANQFSGLVIGGASIFESNDAAGITVLLDDDARNLLIRDSWFENNNLTSTSTNHQLWISGSSTFRLRNLVIDGVNFDGANQAGDMSIDYVELGRIRHVRSSITGTDDILKIGTTVNDIGYDAIVPSYPAGVDPDARGRWLHGGKIVTFTRDQSTASGNQTVSGLDFRPSSVIFLAIEDGASSRFSLGFDNLTAAMLGTDAHLVTSNTWQLNTSNSIRVFQSGANLYTGKIGSFNDDGFVVAWTKTGSPTGTLTVMALCR